MLKEHFKDKGLDEITVMTLVRFINQRLDSETVRKRVLEDGTAVSCKRSPTTVNKEVTLLSSIFRMAIREKVATSNPCDELPKSVRGKIPARRERSRRLSSEEEKALFGTGFVGRREHLRPVSEVALCTGMRKGELFRLKRQDRSRKLTPTSLRAIRSARSRLSGASMCRRQSSAAPDETSIRESRPKPTSAMLPAIRPAAMEMIASSEFHSMVRYSSARPRRTLAARAVSPLIASVLIKSPPLTCAAN